MALCITCIIEIIYRLYRKERMEVRTFTEIGKIMWMVLVTSPENIGWVGTISEL